MNLWTRISTIGDTTCVPESPPCCRCCPWYTCRRCLEEVELIGRVLVHAAANEDEESEKKCAGDHDERHEAENWS